MTTPTSSDRFVGVAEIAEKYGVPRTTVSMWASRRASSGFPKPLFELKMGPLYDMNEVEDWHAERYPVTAQES